MIPLNDTEANRYIRFPVMVVALIVVNVVIMGGELYVMYRYGRSGFLDLVYRFGLIPQAVLQGEGGGGITAVTQMFLHGGVMHLFGNMLALWVYGRRVEDACGPWRFLLYYLTCGAFAEIVYVLARFGSDIPGIGASGAVFGVMGAYLMLYPNGRIRTLIMLGVIPLVPRIRAFWLIGYFFLLQLPPAFNTLLQRNEYDVAHWAHLGGFIGSLFIFLFIRPEVFHRYRNDLPL
jgi:membrane associated rhomboid family serine protease